MKGTNFFSATILGFFLGGPGMLPAGDWGKAPVDKVPVEECLDLGGNVSVGYHSHYLYKGYVFGEDSVSGHVDYTFDQLAIPLTLGVDYVNVVSGNRLTQITNDDLAVSLSAGLPSFAGIDASLSYTYHFYPESPNQPLWPSGNGEFGLHLSRDFQIAVLKYDLVYNHSLPNAWNGAIPTPLNEDRGAWYWDLGLEREFVLCDEASLVFGIGVAYADNYWGTAPRLENGGRTSGWNHYYATLSVPMTLNCRTTLTPYVSYVGAPDSWLLDGAPRWQDLQGQSDALVGGVVLSVSF